MAFNAFELYAKLSLDTGDYEKGLNDASGKTSSFADKMKSGLKTAAKVGAAAIGAATTAVTAFAKASIDAGSQFDAAMSQVAAISGATGADFDSLRDKAMEMGSKTKFSATESAEAFNYMAMAGWKTGDMLSGIEGIMNLAAASGESLATTSDIVTDALTAFGLSAADSGHFADVLAVASSNANTNVGMMGETFKYVAPVAGSLGFSAEDTAAAIGLMANSGIKASQAGTSLRAIMNQLTGPIDIAGEALGEVTIETTNADGSMRSLSDIIADCRVAFAGLTESEQANTASAIFGQEAMSGWLAIMNASESDVAKLTDALANADGAALQMANTMQDNLAGDITIFKSSLEGAQIALSDKLTPSLRQFVQFGTNAVSQLAEAFRSGGLSGAMDALGNVITDGIAMVTEKLPQMVEAGMQLLGALGQGLMNNLPVLSNAAVEIIITLLTGLISALPQLASGAVQIVSTLGQSITEHLPELLAVGGQMLDQLVSGVENGLPDMISRLPQVIDGFLNFITENLPTILQKGVEVLNSLVNGILSAIPDFVKQLPEIISSFVDFISDNLPEIVGAGVDILMNLITGILSAIPDLVAAVPDIIMALVKGIVGGLGTIVETGLTIVTKIVEGIGNGIVRLVEKGKEIVSSVKSGIKQKIDDAKNWGKDLIQNFIDGIMAKWNALKSKVSSVAQTVKNFLGFSEPKEGPLSNFHTYAPDMMELFAKGIEDNADIVRKQFDKSLDFGTASVDYNASGMGRMSGGIGSAVQGAVNEAGGALADIVINLTANLDGKPIYEGSYRYARNRERAYGVA